MISSASASLDSHPARGRQLRVVQLAQERRDPLVRLEDRAPRRLGRVGGEDELDAHPLGLPRELLLAHAGGVQTRERGLERLARDAALVLVGAAAPEPVVLLGDVRELEEDAERPQHDGLALERERPRSSRRAARARPLAARPARERADPLDEVEHLLPLLLDEHAPEEVAEQADVRTQAGIRSHAPSLRARER